MDGGKTCWRESTSLTTSSQLDYLAPSMRYLLSVGSPAALITGRSGQITSNCCGRSGGATSEPPAKNYKINQMVPFIILTPKTYAERLDNIETADSPTLPPVVVALTKMMQTREGEGSSALCHRQLSAFAFCRSVVGERGSLLWSSA